MGSFQLEDADWFFGRDRLTATLVGELADRYARGGPLFVVGVSGAGKSSLLRAGLIPALGRGDLEVPGSRTWPIALFEPGGRPLERLAEVLAARAGITPATASEALRADPRAAADLARRALGAAPDPDVGSEASPRLVVVVDRFEEVLTVIGATGPSPGTDESECVAFLVALAALAGGRPEPAGEGCTPAALVVLGLRADFYSHVLRYADLMPALGGHVVVGPMTETELRHVIMKPATKDGTELEEGLVELLLRDLRPARGTDVGPHAAGRDEPVTAAAHDPGTLPLLEYTLSVIWADRRDRRMTVEGYKRSGGIHGAVARTAEHAYTELPDAQRDTARQLFRRLVRVTDDTADTRRRVSRQELADTYPGNSSEVLLPVLYRFVDERLITVDSDGVEIVHEALLTAWPRLRDWIDVDRAGLAIHRQITDATRGWLDAGRDPDLLHRGTRLAVAEEWAAVPARVDELNLSEQEFLAASIERRRGDQLAARRRTRVLQRLVAGMVVLAVLATTGAVFAFAQRRTVSRQAQVFERERDEAQSRSLANLSRTLRGKDVSLARQLALAAYRISPTVEARSALIDATAIRPAARMLTPVEIMYAVGIHPGGTVAAAAADNAVLFWDITDPGRPAPLPDAPGAICGKIYALAFSPDGNLLAASCGDGSIHLWDTHDPLAPTALPPLTDLGKKVYSVTFSPDSAMMAAAVAEPTVDGVTAGSVRLWTITDSGPRPIGGPLRVDDDAPAKSVAFYPDNRYLAVGTNDGTVRIWDIATPDQPIRPVDAVGATKGIGQLAFSPDGTTLAAGGADFLVHLWSTTDPRNPVPAGPPIDGASTWVNAVTFSPDGATLAIASSDADNGVRLVDLASRTVTATMPHPWPVTSVKFSPDGTSVISGANDGTARIWPVASTPLEGLDYTVSAARFSPDGHTLALGSADLRFYDVTDPRHPHQLGPAIPNPDDFSGSLAFAPGGQLLAESHGSSGTVQLWDVTDPTRPTPLGPPLRAHAQQVENIAFSPDGTLLATASRDGTVRLWDVRTPETSVPLSTPGGFDDLVTDVRFSPDGTLLVATSADRSVRLWNVSDPRVPAPVAEPLFPADHYAYSAVFSPDGTLLAVALADSTVALYDVTDPARPTRLGDPLTGPDGYVFAVAFTTDGTALAATASDGTVWIWDLHGHDQPTLDATLTLGDGAMYPVSYQPGTRLLVAGGDEKKTWLWTTDPDQAAALVCDTSGDPITSEEWARYVPGRSYDDPCP